MRLIRVLPLLFAGLGTAPASRDRFTTAPIIVSTEQVHDWLQSWQKRLHLEDWKIEVKIARIWDLEQGTLGHIDWSESHKTAVIKVLNPVDYDLPKEKVPEDVELSIVHELVHLQLSPLPLNKSSRDAEEQAVTMLANALVELAHHERPLPLCASTHLSY